ncbi:MAG: glutamate synthase, partial [Clostridiales Family XIII bacterium]|nr:glutamate synthase [Clostridiales Family XIII bacterium]
MGKPTGFLEFGRSEAGHRPVAERVRDWDEFVVPQSAEAIHTQSARCMDCGVPFCHAGFLVQG